VAPGGHPGFGSLVGAVGEHLGAFAFADSDDSVRAGRREIVGTAGQFRRYPQHVARRVGNGPHVQAMPAVLVEGADPAVAGLVAL
jgi:hypothetical protein